LDHEELFGKNRNTFVHSKGLGEKGLCFKNNEANNNNLYVSTLRKLLANGLEDRILENIGDATNFTIRGEVYGKGVQDLHYGTKGPEFAVYDVAIDGISLTPSALAEMTEKLALTSVPVLYIGKFDVDELTKYRDDKTALGGANIREGLVVRSKDGTKIAKMISPNYLLRKGEVTEFN
jgi:RNA ligase (TIGR02306 family)